jgi:hypothetical protein
MSEPTILGIRSINQLEVKSILYIFCLVMVFVVIIGIWFRLIVDNDDRTFYPVSEQLCNILIEDGAYLDYYPQKAPVGLVHPKDRNRLSS